MSPESYHPHILDNLKTAILLLGPNLSLRYVNPAAEDLLEISGSRALGEPVSALFCEQGDTLAELQDAVREGSAYTKRETVLTLTSGQQITVDYAVTPIFGGELASTSVVALLIELQPLDRLLRISRDAGLRNSQETTRTLVRSLAHEIKNPLGGLRGAAQLLARELPDSELRDYTRVIIDEADRLRDLVDQMLGPNQLLERKPLNIHEVTERVRQLLEAEHGHAIAFERDYDPSIPEVVGDKQQLIQATLNVARNAVEAITLANPPVAAPRITLRTRALRQYTIGPRRYRLAVRVEIIDNGPGVPEALLPTLFFPMISGRSDGTGLGLSIAQSIMTRHHGLIECTSRPGNTNFSLYLPLDPH